MLSSLVRSLSLGVDFGLESLDLRSGSSNVSLLFRREGLSHEGLSIGERKFNLRESLSLWSNSFPFRNDFSLLVGIPQNERGGVLFIEKTPSSSP